MLRSIGKQFGESMESALKRKKNTKTWTGLYVEESIRMTQDRDKWRKCVGLHSVANPRTEDG